VEAVYRNGLLMITMPKAEEAKPRQVRVQVMEPGRGELSAPEQRQREGREEQQKQQSERQQSSR
jgi:hypothetical protein